MSKELVIELAGKVDPTTKLFLAKKIPQEMDHEVFVMFLQRFFQLATEWEREQNIKSLDDYSVSPAMFATIAEWKSYYKAFKDASSAIRARGETK